MVYDGEPRRVYLSIQAVDSETTRAKFDTHVYNDAHMPSALPQIPGAADRCGRDEHEPNMGSSTFWYS